MKNSDLRKGKHTPEESDLISKGGFVLLSIFGSLMFSDAEFIENGSKKTKKAIGSFDIKVKGKKNEFAKRKSWLFKKLNDDNYMKECYATAKRIFRSAARNYASHNSDKPVNSLFKNRTFDKDYIRPIIEKHLDKKALAT